MLDLCCKNKKKTIVHNLVTRKIVNPMSSMAYCIDLLNIMQKR